MSDPEEVVLIAIYSAESDATRNYDAIMQLTNEPLEIPFDMGVATKGADGTVTIQRAHRTRESPNTRHGAKVGGVTGLVVTLLPGIGIGAAVAGLATGAVLGGRADDRASDEVRANFKERADEALDAGETLLAIVCPAENAPRFDRLLTNARAVLQVDLAEMTDADT